MEPKHITPVILNDGSHAPDVREEGPVVGTRYCAGCHEWCDEHMCWCGDFLGAHYYGMADHGFVPAGCRCRFYKEPEEEQVVTHDCPWDIL